MTMAKKSESEGMLEAERRILEWQRSGGGGRLNLRGLNLTTLPDSLWECTELKKLDLGSNKFTELDKRIEHLCRLEALDVSFNKITSLPDLGKLPQLTRIHASVNYVAHLPSGLEGHSKINGLYIWGNRFKMLPDWISELPALKELLVGGNPLSVLPDSLWQMKNLEILHINELNLASLPEGIRSLKALKVLYVSQNPIESLPEWIGDLADLWAFWASGCKLSSIPSALARCRRLESLDISENPLGLLPLELASIPGLRAINLTLDHLPSDWQAAWKAGGWQSLREHMLKLAGAHDSTKAAPSTATLPTFARTGKLILVGYQENGKTCLQRALRGEPFDSSHKSTHGMNRVQLSVRTDGSLVPATDRKRHIGPMPDVIDFQVWDMGGQDHYQHTHQMFFTPGAIYLAVVKPRAGGSFGKLREWLSLIQKRTKDRARVLVISTFHTKVGMDESISLSTLQAEFPKIVEGICLVDSEDGTGIDDLRKKLATMTAGDQNFNHQWLPGWAETFDALSRVPQPYLSWKETAAICGKHGVTDEKEQRVLASTGHLIGSLLWRNDTPAGEDVVVLNPDWLNGAVARLLDDDQTKRRHGLIEIDDLTRVWTGVDREGKPGYPKTVHRLLITLMEANELAYRPKEKGGKNDQGNLLLVTQMVQPNPPPNLEERWAELKPRRGTEEMRVFTFRKLNGTGNGQVQDLIYLLIFRLRALSLGKHDHEKAIHWQRGLIVQHEYGSVGRIELHDDEIRVRVCSHLCERLLSIIDHEIGEKRDDEMWPGLEKTESLVCGDTCPDKTPGRGRFDFMEWCESRKEGNSKIRCRITECRKWLPLGDIIHAAPPSPEMQQVIDKIDKLQNAIFTRDTATLEKLDEIIDQGRAADTKLDSLIKDGTLTHELINARIDEVILGLSDHAAAGPRLFSVRLKDRRFWEVKGWTKVTYIVTLWCEKSRMPVTYLGGGRGRTGQEEIDIPREWVAKSIPWLKTSVKFSLAFAVLGPLGAGAANAVAGVAGMEAIATAAQSGAGLLGQFTKDWEAHLELLDSFDEGKVMHPDEDRDLAAHPFTGLRPFELREFGVPFDKEDPFIPFIREKYREKDAEFAGLKKVLQPGLGWTWVHPNFAQLT